MITKNPEHEREERAERAREAAMERLRQVTTVVRVEEERESHCPPTPTQLVHGLPMAHVEGCSARRRS